MRDGDANLIQSFGINNNKNKNNMKLNHIYSLMTSALLLFGACTPDDHDFGGAQYSSENLVAPNAYTVTIDGNTGTDPAIFGKNALTRTNTDAIGATGNGVLTQVYVDTENKDIYIAVINTYLAIAENDYNAKKDEVSLKIYDLKKDGKVYYKDSEKVSESPLKASGDDFVIEDVKKDDKFLVTVAPARSRAWPSPRFCPVRPSPPTRWTSTSWPTSSTTTPPPPSMTWT